MLMFRPVTSAGLPAQETRIVCWLNAVAVTCAGAAGALTADREAAVTAAFGWCCAVADLAVMRLSATTVPAAAIARAPAISSASTTDLRRRRGGLRVGLPG